MKRICVTGILILLSPACPAQELQGYLQEALANSPKLKIYETRYEIAREKVTEADWLPDTELRAGYFVSEPETRTGAQRARFTARQMLPWFGTVAQRQKLAETMAETDYVEYLVASRQLELEVAQSYYDLYGLRAKEQVLQDNLQLLRTYEDLALTSVEVGKASAVDVLRLQIRQTELQQQLDGLKETFAAEQAAFNSLLNRDVASPVEVVANLSIPASDPLPSDSLQLNPELLRFDTMYEAVSQAELLNQKERAPTLGLGLDYIPVQQRPDLIFADNGKDIVMPMVTVALPIFSKKYNSRTTQNELRKQEIEFQKQERLNTLNAAFAKALAKRREARILFYAQTDNLEQAEGVEQILLANYETGTVDFEELLDIEELRLKFRMVQVESVARYYLQSAVINYLVNQ